MSLHQLDNHSKSALASHLSSLLLYLLLDLVEKKSEYGSHLIKKKEETKKKKGKESGGKEERKEKRSSSISLLTICLSKSPGARATRSEKEEMPPGRRVHVPTRLAKQHRVRAWNSKNRNNDHPHRQGQTLGSDLPLPHLKVRMLHAFAPQFRI